MHIRNNVHCISCDHSGINEKLNIKKIKYFCKVCAGKTKHLTCNFSQSFPYNQSINMRFFTTDTVAIAKIDFFQTRNPRRSYKDSKKTTLQAKISIVSILKLATTRASYNQQLPSPMINS